MPPSPSKSAEPAPDAPLPVGVWVGGDHSLSIPVSGLLVDDPDLQSAELTPSEWQKRLDAYLRSERP